MSSGSFSERRFRRVAIRRPRLRTLRSPKVLGALLATVIVLGLGWLWFRDSSFVRIKQVTVTGLSGPDVGAIRHALTETAETMTVLNLSHAKLEHAVAPYSTVQSLDIQTHYPHSVKITVNEQVPLADVTVGGRLVTVDAEGRLLSGSTVAHGLLPNLVLASPPSTDVVTDAGARSALRVLNAAPYRLLSHIRSVSTTTLHGVTIQLRKGPALYFGGSSRAAEKWTAAIAVLADSNSHGAAYIDVTDPTRPAAGA